MNPQGNKTPPTTRRRASLGSTAPSEFLQEEFMSRTRNSSRSIKDEKKEESLSSSPSMVASTRKLVDYTKSRGPGARRRATVDSFTPLERRPASMTLQPTSRLRSKSDSTGTIHFHKATIKQHNSDDDVRQEERHEEKDTMVEFFLKIPREWIRPSVSRGSASSVDTARTRSFDDNDDAAALLFSGDSGCSSSSDNNKSEERRTMSIPLLDGTKKNDPESEVGGIVKRRRSTVQEMRDSFASRRPASFRRRAKLMMMASSSSSRILPNQKTDKSNNNRHRKLVRGDSMPALPLDAIFPTRQRVDKKKDDDRVNKKEETYAEKKQEWLRQRMEKDDREALHKLFSASSSNMSPLQHRSAHSALPYTTTTREKEDEILVVKSEHDGSLTTTQPLEPTRPRSNRRPVLRRRRSHIIRRFVMDASSSPNATGRQRNTSTRMRSRSCDDYSVDFETSLSWNTDEED